MEALVAEGRLAEAYWVSRAAGASEHRTLALAFADAAFHDSPASASDLQVKAGEFLDAVTRSRPLEDDRDAQFMLLTAAVRSGISARWASSVLTGDHTSVPGLPDPWARVLDGLVLAVRKGAEIKPGGLRAGVAAVETNRFERIADQARQLAVDLPKRKIRYQRATVVLQALAGPEGVLGETLHAIEEWARKGGKSGAEKLSGLMEEHFRRADAADRLIDDTDRVKRTTKQAKNDIHSGARLQLRTHVKSVQDLLKAALRAAEAPTASGSGAIGPELPTALEAAREAGRPPGVGGALFDLLVRWLDRSYTPGIRDEDVRFPPPADALLMLPGLSWRSEDGRYLPDVAGPEAFSALADMLGPNDPARALAWHRVLLPLVDEARTAFIDLVPGLLRKEISLDYFREQARSQYQVKKQLPAAPLVELEVADLQRASRLLTLTTEQQRRLDILCDARNFLSHLQPLAHRQLMAVAHALISDWVADDVE
ncbi:hypothetical protein [Streptomyces sp. JNUCC 63]